MPRYRPLPLSTKILLVLQRRREATLRELAQEIGADVRALWNAARTLAAKGLIIITDDGRYIITEKGEEKVKEVIFEVNKLLGRVSGGCLAVAL